MRRRVKRRLFLMSMALAAGTPGSAFAKGGAEAFPQAGERLSAQVDALSGEPSTLWSKARDLARSLNLSGETTPPAAAKAWRLELLPPASHQEAAADPRLNKGARFGLALRVAF